MTIHGATSQSKIVDPIRPATPDQAKAPSEPKLPQAEPRRHVRVFVSFDPEHDERLCTTLLEQSRLAASGFEVVGFSDRLVETGLCNEELRQRIGEADQLIVICGEHTEASPSMFAELRIAREERTPHFFLWGQRELVCTRPMGAEPTDAMYSWTPEILLERLAYTRRVDMAPLASHESTSQ
jgi:hypothetical protein